MNLKECRLLVTPTSYGKNDSRLKTELEAQVGEVIYNPTGKPLLSNEVAQLLPGIAGLDAIDANALKTADRLKVICRYGVGVDNVDLNAAREKGIIVTNTPGANSVSVAEWFSTRVVAVGAGSELCPPQLAKEEKFDEITKRAAEFVQVVKSARD